MAEKTLAEAMADGTDLTKLVQEKMGIKSEEGTPATPAVEPTTPAKLPEPETVPVETGSFSQDELSILNPKPKPKGSETPKKEERKPIAGSSFYSAEAAVEAHKSLQRENQRLRDRIDKETPQLIQAGVKEELQRLLAEAPPPEVRETEEEKTLKTDDPEQYRMLQLEKEQTQVNSVLRSILSEIRTIKQQDQVRGITTNFQKVADKKNVPMDLLMAFGSLAQYANTPAEEIADMVSKMLNDAVNKLKEATKVEPIPAAIVDAQDLRPPATGGASAVATETFDVEKIGELGSRGWKQFEKKLVQVALNRLKGGAA